MTAPLPAIDHEKQKQARQYARIRRRLWLLDTCFSALYLLAWLFLGWSISLREWLIARTANEWVLVALYVLIFGGVYSILNLPLGYYSGFMLPHRFEQSNQSFKDWFVDQLKGLAIGVPQLLIILVIVALIFGTKRLKEVGGDLGSAVKSFRKAMNTSGEAADEAEEPPKQLARDEQEKK